MEESNTLFQIIRMFIAPFVFPTQIRMLLESNLCQVILTLLFAGIISAMYGAFGYLLGTKRGGKRG